jgi:hypothetical protein
MPSQKLKSKTRIGSKEIKGCDEPKIPFQRLAKNAALPQNYKDMLKAQCSLYNPVELQQNVNRLSCVCASGFCPVKPHQDTGAGIAFGNISK